MSSSSPGFAGLLRRVVSEYPVDQIGQGISENEIRTDIEERIPSRIRQILDDENLVVKASAGKGRWTSIPWVAILDQRETNSIQEGIYVVYLFEPQEDRVTLTLNQGVTEIKNDLGTKEARRHLEETAGSVRNEFDPTGFSAGHLEFPHASSRNSLYGPGTIFYNRYELSEIPDDEQIVQDLKTIVGTYRKYASNGSTPDDEPNPEPDSYDGISDATEAIRSKLKQSGHENWLDTHLTRSILSQWTAALRGFGPNTQPSPEEVFVFDQIETLFEQVESELEEFRSHLGTGSVGDLSPTETLFIVLVRDLQSKLDLTVNMNHVKFLNLRGNEFDLDSECEEDSEEAAGDDAEGFPIAEYFENNREEITVWRFTSHGDDYPTIYQYGAIQFTDSQKDDFDKIDRGDVVVFYVTQDTKNDDLSSPGKGLIGCGIVSNKRTKNESWWWNEFYGNTDYRNIVEFDELYVTCDIAEIELDTSIDEKPDSTIEAEIAAIKRDRIPHETLKERSQELRGSDFPVVSVLVDLHVEKAENEELVEWILDKFSTRVTKIEYDRDEIDVLPEEESPNRADEIASQLVSTGQVIFHGPPGTGKTHTARKFSRWWLNDQLEQPTEEQLRVVTFHPSFNYEDFLEGLTAKQDETGTVTYDIEDGIFKRICRDAERAYRDADNPSEADPYILIIDEINRGNLAKIFGETITQLERNKRLGADEEVIVELAHSGDEFGIPPNLYVIGTMNTADRSIALVDAALRRRFSFFSFPPNYDVFTEEYDFGSVGVNEFLDDSPRFHQILEKSIAALQVINANILDSGELGKGKRIGHSYLLGLNSAKDVRDAWYYNILPLLEEYYFEELGRLQASVFETEDCDLFDIQNRKIADFDIETLNAELERLLERTDQPYLHPT